jgi:hypothetical protein
LPAGGSFSIGFITCIATSPKTITTNGKTLQQLTFNGINGSWTLQDALTISGSGTGLTLNAGTFNTNNQTITTYTFTSTVSNNRVINFGSSTISVTSQGNVWNIGGINLTFNAGTSTINFGSVATFESGGYTYNNVNFNATNAAGSNSITGANIFNNLTIASPNSSAVNILTIAANQTIRGTLTASGTANNQRIGIYSNVIGTQITLTVNAWSASPANLDFRDIAITGAVGTLSGTSIGDCGNNSGITFTAAKTVYWNLGSSANWSTTGWATSSGGSPNSANFPLAQDTCIFDNAGAMGTVIFNASWNVGTINAAARTSGGFSQGASSIINIYGDIVFGSGMSSTTNSTGTYNFAKQGIQTINTNGANLNSLITINSGTGTLRLLGNLTHNFSLQSSISLTSGTFDLNNFTFLTNGGFTITANALARRIEFGTGAITFTDSGSGTYWSASTLTNFTLTGTPTVNLTGAPTSGTRSILHGSTAGFTETNAISVNVTAGSSTAGVSLQGGFKNINLTGYAATFNNDTRTIYGSLLISTGTTVTGGSSLTTFAGTSVVQDLTSNAKTLDFPITIGGTGNTLRLLDAFTQGTTRAFTINSGATFDANNFSASVGILTFSATPNITNLVSGTLTAQTVTHTGGNLIMSASFKVNVTGQYTLTAGILDFGNQSVSFGFFQSNNSNVRTINLGSGTLTLAGAGTAWNINNTSNLTLNPGTSTLNFTSASAKTMTSGGFVTYYNVNQGGAGALTMPTSSHEFNSISNSVQPTTILFSASTTTTVANLNLNGTAGNLVTLNTTNAPSVYTIEYSGSTVNTMNYVSVSYFNGARNGAFFATNSTNGGNNQHITFAAADTTPRYWVGGTGTWNNTSTANWSTGSGGASGASVPTIETNVFFDANSNIGTGAFTVTLNGTGTSRPVCKDLSISGLDGTLTWAGTADLSIYGSALFPATNFTRTFSGTYTFKATTTGKTITSNGQTITSGNRVTFDGVGGGWTLTDALNVSQAGITMVSGSFNTGGFSVTGGQFLLDGLGAYARSLNLGNSSITFVAGAFLNLVAAARNFTLNAGTSTIDASGTGSSLSNLGDQTFYNLTLSSGTMSTYSINGNFSFNTLTVTQSNQSGVQLVEFGGNSTITNLVITGTTTIRRVMLRSNVNGTQRTLNVTNFSPSDVDFRDIVITGAVSPVSGTRLGDCGGNLGITFPAPKTVYWVYKPGSNWEFANAWALSRGGVAAANNFPLVQDTAVLEDDGLNSGTSIALNSPVRAWNIGTIDASGMIANTVSLQTFTSPQTIYGDWINGPGVTLVGTQSITFFGRGLQRIISAGKTFGQSFVIDNVIGAVTLQDACVCDSFTLNSGNLNTNNQTVTLRLVQLGSSLTRSFTLGTSTINLTGTGTPWNPGTTTNLTFSGASATFNLTDSSTTARTFSGSGFNYGRLNIGGALGTSTLTILGNGTSFNNITSTKTVAHTIDLSSSGTINFDNFNVSGSPGRLVTLTGAGNTLALYNYTGLGVVSIDYIRVTGTCNFTPAASSTGITPYFWYIGENSINQQANPSTGAAFISGSRRAYLLTSSSTWTVPRDWNNNDNIIHMIGAGGGGGDISSSSANSVAGGGGGGGGYTAVSNIPLRPNSLVGFSVGTSSPAQKGGDTYIDATYLAGGGQTGIQNSLLRLATGGQGGIGGTFNGGNGGAGSAGDSLSFTLAFAGGPGGGAGGPLGKGGNGGASLGGSATAVNNSGGGGGGNGGGTNGQDAVLGRGGDGGNGGANIQGAPGGAGSSFVGTTGTRGGGGGGGGSGSGASGGFGLDIYNTIGGAGGSGGRNPGGNSNQGLYGGGGSAGVVNIGGGGTGAGVGSQGVIFIAYTPLRYNARLFSNGDFLLRYNMQLDEITKRTFGYDQNTVYSSQFDEIVDPVPSLGSLNFNGTNGYLTTPYSTTKYDWFTTNVDYTIECWIYPTTYTGWFTTPDINHPTLIHNGTVFGGSDSWSFGIISNTGQIGFYYYVFALRSITSVRTVPLNSWSHIAMTKTNSGVTIFVNGFAEATVATSGSYQSSATDPLIIGTYNGAYQNGYISNLRIVKGNALYSGNFTPPTSPLTAIANTTLLLNTSSLSPFVDSSSNSSTITVNGGVTSSSLTPFTLLNRPPMRTNSTGNTFITGSFDEVTGIY